MREGGRRRGERGKEREGEREREMEEGGKEGGRESVGELLTVQLSACTNIFENNLHSELQCQNKASFPNQIKTTK
jgi:hypothetical protein